MDNLSAKMASGHKNGDHEKIKFAFNGFLKSMAHMRNFQGKTTRKTL